MTIIHDKKYFYKYVTAEATLIILQSRALKYSSPVTFNDPFDVQTRIAFPFEESEIAELYIKEMHRLTHDEKDPCLDTAVPLVRQIQLIRKVVKNSPTKLSQHVWIKEIKGIAIRQFLLLVNNMNAWWSRAARASRIFCVVEEPDNPLMWAHYAQNHKGAVIQFECLPELDNPLCAAMKVNYLTAPPVIAKTPDDYIRYLTGQPHKVDYKSLFYDMYLSKSEHWTYEQEWRVFMPPADMENPNIPKDKNGNEILFEFISLYPKEIHSIYLGCKMSDKDRRMIKELLKDDFSHVKIYESIRNEREYKLDFKEIGR